MALYITNYLRSRAKKMVLSPVDAFYLVDGQFVSFPKTLFPTVNQLALVFAPLQKIETTC